jgi:trans-aconitate 2-methyltransferase
MADWDPEQYERFAAERAQPFWDLAALVEAHAVPGALRRGHDLGCGTGELTARLAERLGVADMTGSDTSPAMLARASAHQRPGLRFEEQDLARWTSPGDHDLVFANASLQWVPDHPGVIARWWAALRTGGHLALQVPASSDHPSHRIAAEVAAAEPFRSAMHGAPPPDPVARNVLAPEQYAIVLDRLGARDQHVRLQVYGHRLGSSADVVEWVKGTSLTRIFQALPAELHDAFVDTYRRRLVETLGDARPYFYPFKRILCWARK